MRGYFKKISRHLLLSSFLFVNSTCQSTDLQKTAPINKFASYGDSIYQIFHFADGTRYRTTKELYDLAKEHEHLLYHEYLKSLQNPETFKKALEIIDSNNDKTISLLEAFGAMASESTIKNLEKVLTQKPQETPAQNSQPTYKLKPPEQ